MEGGWNPPPQCYNEMKKPSAYRVKDGTLKIGEVPRTCMFSIVQNEFDSALGLAKL